MDFPAQFLALGDINGDNQLDIILAHRYNVGIIFTYCD
jgi:hypothetical protein